MAFMGSVSLIRLKSVNAKNPQGTTGLQPDVTSAGLSEINVADLVRQIKDTATYAKRKIPDTAMPLVRAVATWTSRGDIPNLATIVDLRQPSPGAAVNS